MKGEPQFPDHGATLVRYLYTFCDRFGVAAGFSLLIGALFYNFGNRFLNFTESQLSIETQQVELTRQQITNLNAMNVSMNASITNERVILETLERMDKDRESEEREREKVDAMTLELLHRGPDKSYPNHRP